MALTNKLSAIGDAIREKTGKTELLTLDQMPVEIKAIETGGGDVEVEPIVLTGSGNWACGGKLATKYIELFGDTISTDNLTDVGNMFNSNLCKIIPFEINMNNSTYRNMATMFAGCMYLKELPKINNAYPSSMAQMFYNCRSLKDIPEDYFDTWNFDRLHTYNYAQFGYNFQNCHSLRNIPKTFTNNLWGIQTSTSYTPYYYLCSNCWVLDEIKEVGVSSTPTFTSNLFSYSFQYCYRLKDLTFAVNEDGTPKTAKWKNQALNLNTLGWGSNPNNFINYNTGLTYDTQIVDDATYQTLKDHPDSWTMDKNYSRYNHTSAVNTINSLPDCSAYLSTTTGTNTIKFLGSAGALTDGGAINTLTEEEIAVATAKGWTVSLV